MALALAALKDLAAIKEALEPIEAAEQKAQVTDYRQRDRSVLLPSIGNIDPQIKTFAQKSDHVLQSILGLAKLFYGEDVGKKWFESLLKVAVEKYGEESSFVQFLRDVMPALKFIRNFRNCVEHPKPNQRVVSHDFSLSANLELVPPSIEVIHPETGQPRIGATLFMREHLDQLTNIFELFLAFLCGVNAQPFSGIPIGIMQLPSDKRRTPHVQYSYATNFGGQATPIG